MLHSARKIWDAASGNEVMTFTDKHCLYTVSYSPDGKLLASTGVSREINIRDAQTGSLLTTLCGHDGEVVSVAFSPDSKYLVSGADDSTVRVWNIATGKETTTLRGHEVCVTSVAFTLDGRQVVSGRMGQSRSGMHTLIIPRDVFGTKIRSLQ